MAWVNGDRQGAGESGSVGCSLTFRVCRAWDGGLRSHLPTRPKKRSTTPGEVTALYGNVWLPQWREGGDPPLRRAPESLNPASDAVASSSLASLFYSGPKGSVRSVPLIADKIIPLLAGVCKTARRDRRSRSRRMLLDFEIRRMRRL